ncbi:beta-catenin-like protein 1 [Paramacrobiotus metropolitanus]|uniref:beta-catenin-like protein 1 n=1 Tax=Paramacrobiotus metropolitanus TaxID=2943436 RepID=UPI002445FC56|nr:beta-catenin-like protein 1 [Paramacrobiotus metropolitanus]
MNVNDILRFKTKKPGKHGDDETADKELGSPAKSRKIANGEKEPIPSSPGDLPADFFDAETQEIMKKIESAPSAEPFDDTALRKMLNAFERKALKNQEHRVKYSDDPAKFMDSEIELNDAVQELHIIATQPDLYSVVLQMNTMQTLTQLLSHENTDISIAVVDLLQELTDVDTLTESVEDATKLVDAILQQQVVASLLQNMERLDESVKEEADGVHNTLSVMENILEFKPESSESLARMGLLRWLLKRIKMKAFDVNKLYASEILSILLQIKENRKMLGEKLVGERTDTDGIDILLHQLAVFKRHDPGTGEEYEMMENLFDCLCSALMYPPNRKLFLDGEGLQLMNLMLREKKQSRNSAIKVLDYALSSDEGVDLCDKFIEILGLRTIFPLFMKPPKQHKKRGPTRDETEEYLCAIMASLARNSRGDKRERFMGKFLENDLEKVERLMELHFQYSDKVAQEEANIAREKRALRETGAEVDDDTEVEFDLRRLENGLFTLQRIDIGIVEVYDDAAAEVRKRIDRIISMRNSSRSTVTNVVKEYVKEIADDKNDSSKQRDLKRLTLLVQRFMDSPS